MLIGDVVVVVVVAAAAAAVTAEQPEGACLVHIGSWEAGAGHPASVDDDRRPCPSKIG